MCVMALLSNTLLYITRLYISHSYFGKSVVRKGVSRPCKFDKKSISKAVTEYLKMVLRKSNDCLTYNKNSYHWISDVLRQRKQHEADFIFKYLYFVLQK